MARMTRTRILVVEDDQDIAELVQRYLSKAGFTAERVASGREALDVIGVKSPDLLVLDLMLPHLDGLEICRRVRADDKTAHIPIIMLTARADESERIVGLEIGANDYVVKPFFVRELIARIKLQFRNQATPARTLEAGGVELDRTSCQVRLEGQPLSLTATEFRLLEFLMSRPGVVFSREQLLNAVWGQDRAITDRAVDVYVLRLRQKVEKDPANPVLIHSVRGFGYTFEPRRMLAAV